ncbi:MAG: hypothetical protein ABI592_11380 [Acidobacteriota bacterium]
MSKPETSRVDATAGSDAREGYADALKERVELSLAAGGVSSHRAHSKSAIEVPTDAQRADGRVRQK